jgi:cobalamin transport system substrate-binding protein
MITELGRADVVFDVATTANIVNPQIRQRAAAGKIVEYARGRQVDVETVITGNPDVLVLSSPWWGDGGGLTWAFVVVY